MKIRSCKRSDLEAVVNLFTASVRELAGSYYDSTQIAAWAPQPPDLAEWNERLSGLRTLFAEADGELIGFLSYAMNGYIVFLYVSPRHTRCGVASALYREAESTLLSAGVEALFTEASLAARTFFESRGFLTEGEQSINRRGIAFRRYSMRKPLASYRD